MPQDPRLDFRPYYDLVASGKVRELYSIDPKTLLFVASDRISAYDVVLGTPIPDKGRVLTLLSAHWFSVLSTAIPGLKHHFLTLQLPAKLSRERAEVVGEAQGRCMQVRRLRVLPIEAIVRGYITGSAWKEYQASGTVHGMPVDPGLRESDAFPAGPMYTPSTKAEQGAHDENISAERAAEIIGDKSVADRVAQLAVQLYTAARDYARERGILIADTKFEFALDDDGEVVLVDEVLTPDSSRFWPLDKYEVGKAQDSFDKQYLRDWLTREGLKGKEEVQLPDDVVGETRSKYIEAYKMLTGKGFATDSLENLG